MTIATGSLGKSTLSSTVDALRGFLETQKEAGVDSAAAVEQNALEQNFPFPKLASEVFKFIQSKGEATSADDVSEAFVALLMSSESLEALGVDDTRAPMANVREILMRTGENVGKGLLDLYDAVRATGFGYEPTLLSLSAELDSLLGKRGEMSEGELATLLAAMGLPPWKQALAMAWFRRRKKTGEITEDVSENLEALFLDETFLHELAGDEVGPWDIYQHHAQALKVLRDFGRALEQLAEA